MRIAGAGQSFRSQRNVHECTFFPLLLKIWFWNTVFLPPRSSSKLHLASSKYFLADMMLSLPMQPAAHQAASAIYFFFLLNLLPPNNISQILQLYLLHCFITTCLNQPKRSKSASSKSARPTCANGTTKLSPMIHKLSSPHKLDSKPYVSSAKDEPVSVVSKAAQRCRSYTR